MFTASWSNYLCSQVADLIQDLFNSSRQPCMFRLYKNNATVTPATTLGELFECDFDGYSPVAMTGITPTPIKAKDGEYSIALTVGPFVCEGGGQVAYGAYLSAGQNLFVAAPFAVPLTFVSGVIVNIPSQFLVASSNVFP